MMAVGSPIHVPHIAPGQPGYREAVDAAHEQLVKALVELYEKYKVGGKELAGLSGAVAVRSAWSAYGACSDLKNNRSCLGAAAQKQTAAHSVRA
jgi:hypothetical protein